MPSIIGFDATLSDPLAAYTRLPLGSTTVLQTAVDDGSGGITHNQYFTLAGNNDLFQTQSALKSVSPTVQAFPNVDPSAFATKSRTFASAGGFTNPFNYGGLVGGLPDANPVASKVAVLGGGMPGMAVSVPSKSNAGLLLAVGAFAVLGIGLYVFLR
jgi:hypothetical protein